MKKHKLHNLIPGVLIMALLVALAIPALAMTGQKQMTVDYMDIKLAVDGVPAPIGTPLVSEGTTYLPVRAVGEALGKEVRWDGPTHTVYITDPAEPKAMTEPSSYNGHAARKETIEVDYLDIRLVVDGKEVTPRDANGKVVEPFAYQGTTYLPVRAVGEALGKTVRWDGENKTVHLGEMPQATYLVDVCRAVDKLSRYVQIYRAADGQFFEVDSKKYSQGCVLKEDSTTFELGGKYASLTFDYVSDDVSQVYVNGELTQEIEATKDVKTVTVPLNYAQTVSFRTESNIGIANAILNGERAVPEKPAPPANAIYLLDVCSTESSGYSRNAFDDMCTHGANGTCATGEIYLNGRYKTLKATPIITNRVGGQSAFYPYYELKQNTFSFYVDGECVGEITLSQAMPPQTIEIPLNYGMVLDVGDLFLADAILE